MKNIFAKNRYISIFIAILLTVVLIFILVWMFSLYLEKKQSERLKLDVTPTPFNFESFFDESKEKENLVVDINQKAATEVTGVVEGTQGYFVAIKGGLHLVTKTAEIVIVDGKSKKETKATITDIKFGDTVTLIMSPGRETEGFDKVKIFRRFS